LGAGKARIAQGLLPQGEEEPPKELQASQKHEAPLVEEDAPHVALQHAEVGQETLEEVVPRQVQLEKGQEGQSQGILLEVLEEASHELEEDAPHELEEAPQEHEEDASHELEEAPLQLEEAAQQLKEAPLQLKENASHEPLNRPSAHGSTFDHDHYQLESIPGHGL